MGIHQIEKIENYIRFLQENPQELQVLFKELLIGVTSFFRDPEAWEHLKEQVFPGFLRAFTGSTAAGVGGRLLDGGGSLFPGHYFQRGPGELQPYRELLAADFRHRPGPGCH
jgi:hypothetical protein